MSDEIEIDLTNNSAIVGKEFEAACERALTRIGLQGESFAKRKCPVDTGTLRNSITNTVETDEKAAYIGTNVEYAPYVEFGTKKMAAQPFLEPAATGHSNVYKRIIESEFTTAE